MTCLSIIPARGGSKSIPLKNISLLAGRPLIDYSVIPAMQSKMVGRVICNTDHADISNHCRTLGADVYNRPPSLGGDDVSVIDVLREMLLALRASVGGLAEDIVLLMQPTSPFVKAEHIDALLEMLTNTPELGSAQTIVRCPHNHHAINQRIVNGHGNLEFRFPEERARAYNKQKKPQHFLFGNLIAFRVDAFLEQNTVFALPGRGLEIEQPYDFDADNAWDFQVADALLSAGLVELPHMGAA